eukprot:CAMPEP_0184501990 /NCGR_PEP_ID=MMETSP0113_2-20130426/49118_1 /TAXON_ID=91329 /ORGANISM="Norrisiella sphaerica, Strain BC52" /LENGTH=238 /DNA_ID=CAMNT_0026890953 /DNA_START=1 /DNA_END=714 /DNA_ORIENTATION=-
MNSKLEQKLARPNEEELKDLLPKVTQNPVIPPLGLKERGMLDAEGPTFLDKNESKEVVLQDTKHSTNAYSIPTLLDAGAGNIDKTGKQEEVKQQKENLLEKDEPTIEEGPNLGDDKERPQSAPACLQARKIETDDGQETKDSFDGSLQIVSSSKHPTQTAVDTQDKDLYEKDMKSQLTKSCEVIRRKSKVKLEFQSPGPLSKAMKSDIARLRRKFIPEKKTPWWKVRPYYMNEDIRIW